MSRQIGALWLKTAQDGKQFFSGVLNDLSGDIKIVVFKNTRKEKENQPDYQILLSEPKEQDQSAKRAVSANEGEIPLSAIPF